MSARYSLAFASSEITTLRLRRIRICSSYVVACLVYATFALSNQLQSYKIFPYYHPKQTQNNAELGGNRIILDRFPPGSSIFYQPIGRIKYALY